jgi:hypothetical protein
MQETKQEKAPRGKFILILAVGISVAVMFTVTPWNHIPTQVTENVSVIAVTDYGCVAESILGHNVVVNPCSASIGDTIPATFNVPSHQINGYMMKLEARQNPMVDNWDAKVAGIGISP